MSATRPRLRADERRQAVLDTACRVFSKSSYRGATTAEIAREAGITEPILYRHFGSKRDLYLACLDETWRTLREVAGGGRLIVVFQPYRVYRTRDFQAEIAEALAIADEAVILEVFGPGEVREPGEGGVALTAAIDLPAGAKVFVPGWDEVPDEVARRAREGDVVVTMGAPPISLLGDELLAALGERPAGYAPRHAVPAQADERA